MRKQLACGALVTALSVIMTGQDYRLLQQTAISLCGKGAACNNVTDDSAIVQAVLNASPGASFFIPAGHTIYIPAGISIPSNTTIIGVAGSGFRGTLTTTSNPTPIPSTVISVQGRLTGTPVSLVSLAYQGYPTYAVANPFAAEDMALLSNFPTDAGGSDNCTHSTSDGSCSYPNVGPNNLRQTRRREPVQFRSTTSGGVVFYAPLINTYASTQGFQMQKMIPAANVTFRDVNLTDIYLKADLFKNFSYRGGTATRSWIAVQRGLYATIDPDLLDAQYTDSAASVGGSARFVTIRGVYKGGLIYSDNALIRVDQGNDVNIDAVVEGYNVNGGNGMYGVLIDTNYAEAPDGYSDVPSQNISVHVIDSSSSTLSIFASCDGFSAPISNLKVDIESLAGTTVYIKGVQNSQVNMRTPNGNLRMDGTLNLSVSGVFRAFDSETLSDPRGIVTAPLLNTNTDFHQVRLLHQAGDTGSPTDFFNNMINLRLSDIVFDYMAIPTTGPYAQFSAVSGLYLGNVLVKHTSAQTPTFYGDYGRPPSGDIHIVGDFPEGMTGAWSRPSCDANHRFWRWDAAGTSDQVSQCLNVSGTYTWVNK